MKKKQLGRGRGGEGRGVGGGGRATQQVRGFECLNVCHLFSYETCSEKLHVQYVLP